MDIVRLFGHVLLTDPHLVITTCGYRAMLQATANPQPLVPTSTPFHPDTLNLPVVLFLPDQSNSPPLMLKFFTRKQRKPLKCVMEGLNPGVISQVG